MASRTQGAVDPYRKVENTRLLPCEEAASKFGPVTLKLNAGIRVLMVYNDGHLDMSISHGSRVLSRTFSHRGRASD